MTEKLATRSCWRRTILTALAAFGLATAAEAVPPTSDAGEMAGLGPRAAGAIPKGPAGAGTLISFEIEDQFDRVYTENDFLKTILVIIGSDRGGSKYNELWGNAIGDSLRNERNHQQIKFLPVADLRVAPSLVRGIVKRFFPKEKERWVLLDWSGRFARAYDFAPEASNIVVINRLGSVVLKANGKELEQHKLTALCNVLRKLMRE
jgi:hypothetical protein